MLRARLMLGLMLLLIILLSMGLYSIDRCSKLGKSIEAYHQDHGTVGNSLRQMKRGCAVMNSALLCRFTGDLPKSLDDFKTASGLFDSALVEEKNRPHKSTNETTLVGQLQDAYRDYHAEAQTFLQGKALNPAEEQAQSAKLGASVFNIFELVEKLAVAHDQSLDAGGKSSAGQINDTIRFIFLLMILACVATILAWLGLNRGLVDPLRSLTASIQQVGEGNYDQSVPVPDSHELGVLARSFNQMAAQLKDYRTHTSVELLRLNMTIRATLASFPDPIFVLNSAGAVEFRNPVADQLAVQLLFAGVTRLPRQVDLQVERVRATGEDYLPTLFREAIKFHINGQDRYYLPRIVQLRDDAKKTFGVAVILEDVTRMLLLDDVKSNLISTVSHELKTPLTSVRMALYLLYEKTVGELNEKQIDLVATAREDADRLLRTLNDLLDLAKLEHGPSQLDLSRLSPNELIDETARHARETIKTPGLKIQTEVEPDLGDVEIDRQRIAYVFNNLITNAVKYSPPGSPILLRAEKGKSRAGLTGIRFSVRDRGPGIAPEHKEHIFERFYRVPGTDKPGAGLGLSITREIVVAHRGDLGVISTLGEGSEFFFILPEVAKEPDDLPADSQNATT